MSDLELLLQHYLIYNKATDSYVVDRNRYHKELVPKLKKLLG